jgi:hypothetical protein
MVLVRTFFTQKQCLSKFYNKKATALLSISTDIISFIEIV